jgi:hypothetical protein
MLPTFPFQFGDILLKSLQTSYLVKPEDSVIRTNLLNPHVKVPVDKFLKGHVVILNLREAR